MTAKLLLVKSENGLETRQDYDGLSSVNPAFAGVLTGASAALTGDVDAGGEIKSDALAGAGTRPLVALADGTIDDQDAATFRGTIGALSASLKGAANGVAELGADGRVPTTQLPSYVDDVLEYANFAAFPATGETGKIYINLDQNKTWRWSGSGYAEISASLALGETSATAYRGDRGKAAYDHSQVAGNPHGTTAADVGAAPSTHMHLSTDVRTGADAQVGGILVSSSADPDQPFIYGITPRYGHTDGGPWRFLGAAWQEMPALSDSDVRLGDWTTGKITNDHVADGAAIAWNKISKTGAVAADIGAAKAPSKREVSASTTIGSIDASAIKVTATDVNLTLSGGVNGQGWDVINPTTATGIAIPSGTTLWKTNGFDVGPTTIALGGGRPIRITRIDANTWTMLGSQ